MEGRQGESMSRKCGNCTLCCKLLPQAELNKAAGQRCQHQRHTGCRIYPRRPASCRLWSCMWLVGDGTEAMSRPDVSHYVVDVMPDYVTAVSDTGERQTIGVLQVWVDPRHPDAHRDPALRAFLDRYGGEKGMGAIIRYGSSEGFTLFPPSLTGGRWIEHRGGIAEHEHSAAEKMEVLGGLFA